MVWIRGGESAAQSFNLEAFGSPGFGSPGSLTILKSIQFLETRGGVDNVTLLQPQRTGAAETTASIRQRLRYIEDLSKVERQKWSARYKATPDF